MNFLAAAPLSVQRLIRVGGAGDKGVDLRGWWQPSGLRNEPPSGSGSRAPSWPVVVQCKAESRRLGPGIVRELEGVAGYEVPTSTPMASADQKLQVRPPIPTIAFLVGLSGFSEEAHRRAAASCVPIVLVHLPFAGLSAAALKHQLKDSILKRDSSSAAAGTAASMSFNAALKKMLGDEATIVLRRRFADQADEVDVNWEGS